MDRWAESDEAVPAVTASTVVGQAVVVMTLLVGQTVTMGLAVGPTVAVGVAVMLAVRGRVDATRRGVC